MSETCSLPDAGLSAIVSLCICMPPEGFPKAAAAAAAAAAAEALEDSPAQRGHKYSSPAAASAMERHGVHARCTHESHVLQPTW